jgi:uncharacterized protein (TIGR02300 family)
MRRRERPALFQNRDITHVAKPELGGKHQCQNCGAKFFDLNRDPIVCPKCGTVFQGAPARVQPAAAKEEEADETAATGEAELISLEDAEAPEEKVAAAIDDEVEVEDDDSAEDTFLEEEEEEDDDVSGLIDGDIANDEEP